jgi:glycosyltransferase involved in cell wall biosynthesis
METLGMGVPVVSPTLIHIPDLDVDDDVGVVTPYLRSGEDAVRFARQLLYAIKNLSTFKPAVAREIVKKFYSWESFVNDFKDTLENIMDNAMYLDYVMCIVMTRSYVDKH